MISVTFSRLLSDVECPRFRVEFRDTYLGTRYPGTKYSCRWWRYVRAKTRSYASFEEKHCGGEDGGWTCVWNTHRRLLVETIASCGGAIGSLSFSRSWVVRTGKGGCKRR
jgi:hypothetical protein